MSDWNIVLVTLETHEQVHKNIDKCPKIKKLRQDLILFHNIGLLLPDKINNMESAQSLSYGQKAVGVSFNPSLNPEVDKAKMVYAALIDDLSELRGKSVDTEVKRMVSVAITELQTAQMWHVKALTWK